MNQTSLPKPTLRKLIQCIDPKADLSKIPDSRLESLLEKLYKQQAMKTRVAKKTKITSKVDTPLVHSNQWRLAIYRAIKNGTVKFDACRVDSMFEKINKIMGAKDKKSASDTVIILGELKVPLVNVNDDVVAKISFPSLEGDNSAIVEATIYSNVTMPLMLDLNTPHTMLFVGYFHCYDFFYKIYAQKDRTSNYIKQVMAVLAQKKVWDLNTMNMLVIEQGRGKSLQDWMSVTRSWADWKAVLFQLVYTLECFAQVGLQHNDLHIGNVWIDTVAKQETNYQVGGRYYQTNSKYFVKIYDFDLATKFPTKYNQIRLINQRLDLFGFCDRYGFCNKRNRKYDLFKVLSGIWLYAQMKGNQPPELVRFIEQSISPKLLNENLAWQGSLCKSTGGRVCIPIYPDNREMKTPKQIMRWQLSTLTPKTAPPKSVLVWRPPSEQ